MARQGGWPWPAGKHHEEQAYHNKRDDDERASVEGEWIHLGASFEGVANDFEGAESVIVTRPAPELVHTASGRRRKPALRELFLSTGRTSDHLLGCLSAMIFCLTVVELYPYSRYLVTVGCASRRPSLSSCWNGARPSGKPAWNIRINRLVGSKCTKASVLIWTNECICVTQGCVDFAAGYGDSVLEWLGVGSYHITGCAIGRSKDA